MKHVRHWFLSLVMKGMFKAVMPEEVLYEKGNKLFIGNTELSEEQKRGIILDAQRLLNSSALVLVFKELTVLAHQKMFDKAGNFDDLLAGKTQLWAIDMLRQLIGRLANLK